MALKERSPRVLDRRSKAVRQRYALVGPSIGRIGDLVRRPTPSRRPERRREIRALPHNPFGGNVQPHGRRAVVLDTNRRPTRPVLESAIRTQHKHPRAATAAAGVFNFRNYILTNPSGTSHGVGKSIILPDLGSLAFVITCVHIKVSPDPRSLNVEIIGAKSGRK